DIDFSHRPLDNASAFFLDQISSSGPENILFNHLIHRSIHRLWIRRVDRFVKPVRYRSSQFIFKNKFQRLHLSSSFPSGLAAWALVSFPSYPSCRHAPLHISAMSATPQAHAPPHTTDQPSHLSSHY